MHPLRISWHAIMACQSVRREMLRNISWENASCPCIACNIVETMEHKACMTVARASSKSNTTWWHVCGGWASKSVFNTDTTVWCLCLQLALDRGFIFVVGTNFMFNNCNSSWKAKPTKSPPLSQMQLALVKGTKRARNAQNVSNVVARFLKDHCKLDKVSSGVNVCKKK